MNARAFFFATHDMLLTIVIAVIILALVYAMTRSRTSTRVLPVLTQSPVIGITAIPDLYGTTGLTKGVDGFKGVPSTAPESITGAYNGVGAVVDGRYMALSTLWTR